jgi:hypothetical protein
LEGRAEVLEAARLRYRELLRVLQGSWWRPWQEQLQGQPALLQTHIKEGPVMEEALAAALRRAQAEQWPAQAPIVRCMHEVRTLQEQLVQLLMRRLEHEEAPLTRLLQVLEERRVTAPREIPPARRWRTALELLPDTLPELHEATAFGDLLASLFSGAYDLGVGLRALGEEPLGELRRRWARGEEALEALWRRLAGVDTTGGLVADLRQRAARAPAIPRTGPDRLVYAEYWRAEARSRLLAWARSWLKLVEPTEAECLEVGFWLCTCEGGRPGRLPASEVLEEGRAGQLELAHLLWEVLGSNVPEEELWPEGRWERMLELARRADSGSPGPDVDRLRQALMTLYQRRMLGTAALRGWRAPDTLEELVFRLRPEDGDASSPASRQPEEDASPTGTRRR